MLQTSTWSVRARRCVASTLFIALGGLAAAGCDDDPAPALVLTAQDPLFSGFSYDTGLVPADGPVQASFSVVANGNAQLSVEAVASGDADSPTLTGIAGTGDFGLSGSFGLEGRLVVDISGLPSYDGPIPGIENVAIEFGNNTPFDPFSIDATVETRAEIPATTLPEIPLPGGIPGSLILEVAEGSHVAATLTGVSACVGGDEARYETSLSRTGLLVIHPSVAVEVPLLGTQTFDIPAVEVPLSLGESTVVATSAVGEFGGQPDAGDHQSGKCGGSTAGAGGGAEAGGAGGSAQGGSAQGGSSEGGGSGTTCTSADDCDGLPCVEGTCSQGGGLCESGTSFGDMELDQCVSSFCCSELETCTFAYDDIAGCNACIMDGSGPRCDALIACIATDCNGVPATWTCEPGFYGAGDGCDCGCGETDPDCADATVDACTYCDGMGSCSAATCPGDIDPSNNAMCL